MIKNNFFVVIVVMMTLLMNCGQIQNDFVTVDGTGFEVNGKPYYFLGTNIWYGANLGSEGNGGDRERLIKELDLLKSLGITNIRIMGASEGHSYDNTVNPPLQPQLGIYDENVLEGLDFLLSEMGKRGMYAVIFLNNYWVWTGGMAQYIAWVEETEMLNPFMNGISWAEFMKFSGSFYTNEKANKYYRQYIKMLINRENKFTRKLYKNDPVIMSWQLANEPRPNPDEDKDKNLADFVTWIDETANYIKSLDENHLVSTGNEGIAGCLQSEQCYLQAHSSENIDYLTMHLWILNWGWYDPKRPEETYQDAEQNSINYLNQHIDYAKQIGKPLTIEEFGIPRDNHSYSPNASTIWRDRFYSKIFREIYESSVSGSPLVGSNFWTWGGYGKASDPYEAKWQNGDDFTGDPPQEPQGRNSVYATDKSTLDILSEYGSKMEMLRK